MLFVNRWTLTILQGSHNKPVASEDYISASPYKGQSLKIYRLIFNGSGLKKPDNILMNQSALETRRSPTRKKTKFVNVMPSIYNNTSTIADVL